MSDQAEIWARLARLTPARIGLGRAGSGQTTRSVLGFGLAHAQARDAVHTPMDAAAIRAGIEALGLPVLDAASRAGPVPSISRAGMIRSIAMRWK